MKKNVATASFLLVAVLGAFYLATRNSGHPGAESAPSMNTASQSATRDGSGQAVSANLLAAPLTGASAADQAKLSLLNEILESKNDNDPRLDQDLRQLNAGTKTLFQDRYRNLAREKLNERGTIVFLLGRNLANASDFGFLGAVLDESPCRSFEDCQKDQNSGVQSEHLHHEAGNEVTLAYPQIVALKSIENYLSGENQQPEMTERAREILKSARDSKAAIVSKMATELYQKFFRG